MKCYPNRWRTVVNLAHSNIKIYHQRVNTTKYIKATFVSHVLFFSFPLIRTQDMNFVHNISINTHSLKYCALLSYLRKKNIEYKLGKHFSVLYVSALSREKH